MGRGNAKAYLRKRRAIHHRDSLLGATRNPATAARAGPRPNRDSGYARTKPAADNAFSSPASEAKRREVDARGARGRRGRVAPQQTSRQTVRIWTNPCDKLGASCPMRDAERRSRTLAKKLRKNLTNAETILWSQLQQGRSQGYRFRRQHPIGPFVADFASMRARLVIEIDGATHGSDEEQLYDQRREAYLRKRGWRVVRFRNGDVYEDAHAVVDAIYALITPLQAHRSQHREYE